MKKVFAVFTALALILAMAPFNASAVETEELGYSTLVDKAAAAFPEYAEKLLNPSYYPSAHAREAETGVLVVSETRAISDTESVTYAEYSDGLILLSGYEFTYDTDLISSTTGSTYKNVTIDIEAACVTDNYYTGYFYLDGFSYTLRSGYDNFDSITDPGDARKGSYCSMASLEDYTENESYTGYARVEYSLGFKVGPQASQVVTSYLTIHVGEDTIAVDHLGWN